MTPLQNFCTDNSENNTLNETSEHCLKLTFSFYMYFWSADPKQSQVQFLSHIYTALHLQISFIFKLFKLFVCDILLTVSF